MSPNVLYHKTNLNRLLFSCGSTHDNGCVFEVICTSAKHFIKLLMKYEKNHENIGRVLDILRFICYHKKARRRGRRIMVITRACQA
jgi:hypothetical protein